MSIVQREEFKQTLLTLLREDPQFRQSILQELKKETEPPVRYVEDKALDETIEKHFTRFDDVFKALA